MDLLLKPGFSEERKISFRSSSAVDLPPACICLISSNFSPSFFFYHIYLARVSRLMPKSFGFLCISPASTNRNVNKFTKCEHFTASNKCRAVSFGARSSLMFCLIWIGAAWSAPFSRLHCRSHKRGIFSGQPIHPATSYISGPKIWIISSNDFGRQRKRGRLQIRPVRPVQTVPLS